MKVMFTQQVLVVGFLVLYIQDVKCSIPLVPVAFSGAGMAGLYAGYSYLKCKVSECCIDNYSPSEISHVTFRLNYMFNEELFGQKIAHQTVLHAIGGHLSRPHPIKPLSMSFHGCAGTGKNFVVKMIAKALFEKGEYSKYFHYFNGRDDFPHGGPEEVYKSRAKLQNSIVESIQKCDRSLFVFDEVEKIPPGVLDALVPILDYTTYYRISSGNKNKSIFVFLSNTGETKILERLLELWEGGRKREELQLQDFEKLITIGAFNEKGGFYKCDAIGASLIDHYVPFLPLEESHVISCIKRSFRERMITNPPKEMIEEALTHTTYGPEPHNLYSQGGCKRIDHKVATIVNRKSFNEV